MKSYINAVWNNNDYNKNNYKAVNNKVKVLGSGNVAICGKNNNNEFNNKVGND